MNRRIVLIDQDEIPDYLNYFGCGLGNEIYTLQSLNSLSESERSKILRVGESDAIMVVGGEPFKYLQSFYHFGVRSENYFDCSKLHRLSIEGGAFIKCVVEFPDTGVISDFMGADFAKPRDFSWFKQKVIHTYEEAIRFLDYLDSLPQDTMFGFDYEASGMPLDKWFEISGASICTIKYGGFISFTDIRHQVGMVEYEQLLGRLRNFLFHRMDHIWTYNMQYEFQVSHRMLGGVDLYNLCDASVFNILDGNHIKKYSLKWTANMILESTVWDTEFDRISDLIDSMLFEEVGKLKKERHKVLKVTQENFKNTPEWNELCSRYPNYIDEFERLIIEYWGNPFMCIPSDILGYYCNLDAFYTLMIYEARKSEYTEKAINVFLDNIRLQTRLHSCGIPKDEEFRLRYEDYCQKQMAWGITYCATARCKIKMMKHAQKMANIKSYSPVCQKLLKKNKFFGGNALEITKDILSSNIDSMEAYELGLNEGSLLMKFGEDFSVKFLDIVRKAMEEVGMIKLNKKTGEKYVASKIDAGIIRKKKILGIISDGLSGLLGLGKLRLGTKHEELEKYLYYERAYSELTRVSTTQLNDINNIPSEIVAFNSHFTLLEYSDYVSENYFKCKSPIENDEICFELASIYPCETSYLAAIFESTQQLNGADKFYDNLGIKTIEDAFNHFMTAWEAICVKGAKPEDTDYPEKIFTLAGEFYNAIVKKKELLDPVKEVWSNFNGYTAQEQFFKYVSEQYEEYSKTFKEEDLTNNFGFMRKITLHYLMYKKYAKVLSTYINGMFLQTDKWVIEDPKSHVVIRECDKDEPGAIRKMFARFQCMEKSSKRWSSGYHKNLWPIRVIL